MKAENNKPLTRDDYFGIVIIAVIMLLFLISTVITFKNHRVLGQIQHGLQEDIVKSPLVDHFDFPQEPRVYRLQAICGYDSLEAWKFYEDLVSQGYYAYFWYDSTILNRGWGDWKWIGWCVTVRDGKKPNTYTIIDGKVAEMFFEGRLILVQPDPDKRPSIDTRSNIVFDGNACMHGSICPIVDSNSHDTSNFRKSRKEFTEGFLLGYYEDACEETIEEAKEILRGK